MKNMLRARRGFSLVEVVLALGVAAFCLLAIFGLLPVGVNSNRTSIEQTVAANLGSMVMADLQAIPKGYVSTLAFATVGSARAGQVIKTRVGTAK